MHKDLFNLFGYVVQTHAVVSILAIILGYGVGLALTRGTIYYKHLQNFVLYAVLGAMIGARIWHVFVFQWPTYSHHPLQILEIWNGGISIEGAIAGGIAALIIYTTYHKISFMEMGDYLAPAMILAQGIGRIACFMNGDAFGRPTGGKFGLVYPPGTIAYSYYGSQPLWPAEVFESQGNMILFCILFMILVFSRKKLPKGFILSLYVFLYFLERFILEYFRGDSPRYGPLTGGQWSAIGLMLLAVISILYLLARGKRPDGSEAAVEESPAAIERPAARVEPVADALSDSSAEAERAAEAEASEGNASEHNHTEAKPEGEAERKKDQEI